MLFCSAANRNVCIILSKTVRCCGKTQRQHFQRAVTHDCLLFFPRCHSSFLPACLFPFFCCLSHPDSLFQHILNTFTGINTMFQGLIAYIESYISINPSFHPILLIPLWGWQGVESNPADTGRQVGSTTWTFHQGTVNWKKYHSET